MSAEHFRGGNASTPVPQASSAFQTPQSVRIKPEPDNDSPYSPSLGQISRAETPMSDISTGAPPPTSASARPVGSEVGIFNAVSTLANRLGLDQPTYEVQPDGDEAGIFRGRARFRLGAKVPENIGEVRDVNGKILAKTLIAEQVLSWLQEEDRIRQQTIASMLGRVGGAPETGNMEV